MMFVLNLANRVEYSFGVGCGYRTSRFSTCAESALTESMRACTLGFGYS